MRSMREWRLVLCVVITVPVLWAAPAYSSHNGVPISALAIDPLTPSTLYAATPGGVFKSTNGGASWRASGLSSVSSLVIDPLTPTTLYAGSGGVFKSTDGGANWNPTARLFAAWSGWAQAGAVSTLAIDPQTPTTLYAGTLGSPIDVVGDLYRSLDGGQSWEAYGFFLGMSLACDPCGGIVALAAAPRTVLGVTAAFTSYDLSGFVYWEAPSQVTLGELINPGFAVAIDPVTPTTLYAGKYKSTDGGATWFATGLTGVSGVQALAIDPLTPTTLYAGSLDVHKSVDGGATWIATGFTNVGGVRTLAIDPLTPTIVYAGTGTGGVYKSTDGGANWNPTGSITWSHISSLSLNPASVVGGNPSTGTVTLNAPAPADGALVELGTWNTNIASVPASVWVTEGATSADFVVSTSPVDASRNVLVWGAAGGDTSSAVLTVTTAPATLSSLSLNPTSVAGGVAVIGTVTLNTAAPDGGAVVALSSSNPTVATVPAGVTVAAGATSADFAVSTSQVTNSTSVAILATYGGSGRSAALTVTPITTLSLLSLSPPSVTAGNTSTGTVTLTAAAPTGGAVVPLASSSTSVATVPASVTVAAGATSATFTVSTSSLIGCASSVVNISATYGGVTRSAGLTATPAMDTVAIQQADYFTYRHELRVAATSTGSTAALQVYVTSTGALIGTLRHYDGNRYSGRFTWPVNPQNITVRSSLCGSAMKAVILK